MRRLPLLALLTACATSAPDTPTTPATSEAAVEPTEPSAPAADPSSPQVLGSERFRMPGAIQYIEYRGEELVAVSRDGTVRFFDRRDGEPRRTITVEGEVWGAHPAARGVLLNQTNGLRLLDLDTGELGPAEETPGRVLLIVGDGRRFFVADEKVLVAQAADGSTQRLELPQRPKALAVAPGARFVAVGLAGRVLLFESGADQPAHGLAAGGNGALAVDPRNRWVVVENPAEDLRLGVWDLASGERVRELDKPRGNASRLDVSSDGRFLAAVVMDELAIWRTEDWQRTCHETGLAHVRSVTFSANGDEIAVAGNDNSVRLLSTAGCVERPRAVGHNGPAEALTWGADGTLYSGGRFDGQVLEWSTDGNGHVLVDVGRQLVESVLLTDAGVWALTTDALHPIGIEGARRPIELPGIGRGGTVCEAGLCLVADRGLFHWSGSLERVTTLRDTFDPSFDVDGSRMLVRARGAMVLRRTRDGEELARFPTEGSCLLATKSALGYGSAAVFETVRQTVESEVAGRLLLWPDTGGEPEQMLVMDEEVNALAMLSEGLVAIATDVGLQLWRPGSNAPLRTLPIGRVWSLAWREESETLAAGLRDGRIALLDRGHLDDAPVTTATEAEVPTGCPPPRAGMGIGGLGLMGGGGGGPDARYFGMFADPHHQP